MKQLRKLVALLVIAAFAFAGFLYLREQASAPAPPLQEEAGPVRQPDSRGPDEAEPPDETGAPQQSPALARDGSYTDRDDVALYLHLYGELPGNFLTKREAQELGWDSAKGNLDEVAPGMSIGGDRFGNYEGLLPEAQGRAWYECDIGYEGGYRGAQRLVYSSDGLVYYTEDHYETFERLY